MNLEETEASRLFLCFTGINYPQTVPVTVLGPMACSRQHAAPGSTGIPILPGMVCTTVVGEPHCEVSSNSQSLPSRPLAFSHPAVHEQTSCQARLLAFLCQLAPKQPPNSFYLLQEVTKCNLLPNRASLGHHLYMRSGAHGSWLDCTALETPAKALQSLQFLQHSLPTRTGSAI